MKKEPINRKDTSAFDDSYTLAKSVKEIIEKGDTDRETFGRILSENECSEEFLENIASEEKFSEESIRLERAFQENDSELLVKKIEGKTMAIRRKRIALSSAAVAAGIVALFFYLFTIPSNVQKPKTNIATVVERPTIIMEDNSVVELKSDKYVSGKSVSKTEVKNPERHLIVPAGCTFTIELEDRSLITLNAGSELIYPVTFTGEQREVKLQGEGYFKVAKSAKPFVVRTGDSYTKVYGTEFNINANDPDLIRTVLVEGSVGLGFEGEKNETMLKPNQLAITNMATKTNKVENVDPSKYLAWMDGYFRYDEDKLEYMLSEMAVWYNVKFSFESDSLKNILMVGSFRRSNTIEELIVLIEETTNVKFIKEGGSYKVKH